MLKIFTPTPQAPTPTPKGRGVDESRPDATGLQPPSQNLALVSIQKLADILKKFDAYLSGNSASDAASLPIVFQNASKHLGQTC